MTKPRCRARGMLGCVLLALGAVFLFSVLWSGENVPEAARFAASGREWMPEEILCQQGNIPVNAADTEWLDELPGVGEATARSILQERAENGPFHYPEDLMQVSGIGEKKLEQMRDMLDMEVDAAMDLGIIGGADGPTAILITSSLEGWLLLGAVGVAAVIVAVYWIVLKVRKGG